MFALVIMRNEVVDGRRATSEIEQAWGINKANRIYNARASERESF